MVGSAHPTVFSFGVQCTPYILLFARSERFFLIRIPSAQVSSVFRYLEFFL